MGNDNFDPDAQPSFDPDNNNENNDRMSFACSMITQTCTNILGLVQSCYDETIVVLDKYENERSEFYDSKLKWDLSLTEDPRRREQAGKNHKSALSHVHNMTDNYRFASKTLLNKIVNNIAFYRKHIPDLLDGSITDQEFQRISDADIPIADDIEQMFSDVTKKLKDSENES